jgi:hypothetical protein
MGINPMFNFFIVNVTQPKNVVTLKITRSKK